MEQQAVEYPLNEAFVSVQGEGRWTGTASVFLRLQGCDVGCPWCDTKHTWEAPPEQRVSLYHLTVLDDPASKAYALARIPEVIELVSRLRNGRPISHVVITGGEPALHDLDPLIAALVAEGYRVQVETSGTCELPMRADYWCTLSPKIGMPGGKRVRATSWLRADEIKLPVGKLADIDAFDAEAARHGGLPKRAEVYLQPISQSIKATHICLDQALARGWAVSIQQHKNLGLR